MEQANIATLVSTSTPSTEEVSEGTESTEETQEETTDGDVSRETTADDTDDAAGSHGSAKEEGEEEAEEESEKSDGKKKLSRKVDGKVVSVTEDELWKSYGLNKAATARSQEAAALKKESAKKSQEADQVISQVTDFFESIRKTPELALELLEKLGHDPKQIVRKKALEELEYDRMDPKDREILELRKKAELADRLQQERVQGEAKRKEAQLRQHFTSSVDNLMAETFKLSGLQPKPKTIARIAEACQTLINASKTPGELPTPQAVLDKFLGYGRQDLGEFYGEQDPEELAKLGMLPDNLVDSIVKWHLAKNKANLPSSFGNKQAAGTKKPISSKQSKPMSIDQFFNNIGSKN